MDIGQDRKAISRRGFLQLAGGIIGGASVLRPVKLFAQQPRMMSLGTGGVGGVYYIVGGAIANILNKNLPNTKITAEVTGGAIDNAKLIGAQKAEMAIVASDTAYDAYTGAEKFSNKIPLRTILVVFSNYFHFVVKKDSGIRSLKDLRKKRVSLGAPGGGNEVKAIRLLKANGLDIERDIKRDRLSVSECAAAMKDNKLDAFFWNGGVPTSAILDLAATPGMQIEILDLKDSFPKLKEQYGLIYFSAVIPKGTYSGIDYDVNVPAVGNVFACHEKMDETLSYQVAKIIIENKNDLAVAHQAAKDISLENAVIGSPIPFHPGAIRYFKEKGIAIKQ